MSSVLCCLSSPGADSSNPYQNFENANGSATSSTTTVLRKLIGHRKDKSKATMVQVDLPPEEVLTSKTLAERINDNREKYMAKVNKE